ncbi:hypothetical protein OESDEN_05929 [Oesophagostomum dentatum]|uniref:Chitin-binding type-2 domain-containing protein n=1 Tax=Oesophagostomum dentatum TaxID=61180 RepID=A0A0B1TAA5_OESDE|nr:hypothetical protein OESDEN_05929 [Oesophagostomum dentatum]
MNLFFVAAFFVTMLCQAVSGTLANTPMCSDKHYYQLCPDEFVGWGVDPSYHGGPADYWMCSDPYYYTLCQDDIVALVVDPGYYDYPAYDYVIGVPIYVYDDGYAYPYADHPCDYYYRILSLKLDDLPP